MAGTSNAFLDLFQAFELKCGSPARLGTRRAVANLVGRSHVDEDFQLVVQVALGLVPPEHPPHDRREAMQEHHAPSNTLATANETRFHRARCCSRWRRPEAVRR